MREQNLTDTIYEAALVPELWPRLLERIAHEVDAVLGSIFISGANGNVRWIGTEGATKLFEEFEGLNPPIEPIRFFKAAALDHVGFYTDHDFNDPAVFDHPVYTEFLYPRGLGWHAAAAFDLPTGEKVSVGFERTRNRGSFDDVAIESLNRLRPHLGRASVLSAQLGLARARGMTEALNSVGIPAAVLKAGGRLHVANERFQGLMPDVAQDRKERLLLLEPRADALLVDALSRFGGYAATGQSRSIPVPAREDRPPFIFHVVPVVGAANDIFMRGLALVIATPIDRATVPSAEVLQGLFDLTPAEARVARSVAQGNTIEAIAFTNGVSRETVRTQLASVLAKTGMSRQAELVALLAGKAVP